MTSQAQALQQQSQQQSQQTQAQQQAQAQHPQQSQLSYSLLPQMQTINIDGQEALFIPAGAAAQQAQPAMQFTTADGQQVHIAGQQMQLANGQTIITPHQPMNLIRAPNVFPSIIQNIGAQTVQLPTGKNHNYFQKIKLLT